MPAGRTVTLVSINGFPEARLHELAAFYAERYGLQVQFAAMVGFESAMDPARQQVVAERLIESMRINFNPAREAGAVVIAVTGDDLYVTSRPDWAYAFGTRVGARLGVISTARLTSLGPFSDRVASARLRKLVTKYIGTMSFGLPDSSDPRSVLYGNILGPDDLDGMGEDF
jgi:hypothetical protein